MSSVTLEGGEFSVDAAILAEDFGLDPALVLPAMRAGKITSRCERGTGADAGRSRLTFFYAQRRLRLVIDAAGNILERSVDLGGTPGLS